MQIAVTGATGFIGGYLVKQLGRGGHQLNCWHRASSDPARRADLEQPVTWFKGELGDQAAAQQLVAGCDAVVHAALWRPGDAFPGSEGDLLRFAEVNLIGTLQLIEAARGAGVSRFVYLSSCAVHEEILDDRPLDETHPLWPRTHYGAHKAAVEKFVHSYGLGAGYPICALRPTGVYGVRQPIEHSKWYKLVQRVVRGETVDCVRGGKEVHAADVARAVELLLDAKGIAGQVYSCYDRYISEFDVATFVKEISGSSSLIQGGQTRPRHQIVSDKIRNLGMKFGGHNLFEQTLRELIDKSRVES